MKFKVLNLNLWEGGRLMDEAIGFIKKEDPDILAMQEVHDGHDQSWDRMYRSIDVLRAQLPALEYAHFAPTFLAVFKFGKLDEGNAVFSKYPIVQTNIIPGAITYRERVWDVEDDAGRIRRNLSSPRNLQHVAVDAGGTVVNVFNTQGVWGQDGNDNADRLDMAESIANSISEKDNVVLCGDFNFQLQGTKTLEIIEQKGNVHNIFAGGLTSTFNMKRKPPTGTTYGTAIVDGIFVSPNIKVGEHYCPDVDISDHLPLVATLEV